MSLAARLTKYLEGQYPSWIAAGELERLARDKAGQTGRTAVRRLEELREEGILEVQYRERNHAYYRFHKKVPDTFEIVGMWEEKSPWTGEVTGEYHEIYA